MEELRRGLASAARQRQPDEPLYSGGAVKIPFIGPAMAADDPQREALERIRRAKSDGSIKTRLDFVAFVASLSSCQVPAAFVQVTERRKRAAQAGRPEVTSGWQG